MTTRSLESLRKYSIHVSKNEAIAQLTEQLHQLLANTRIDFQKRKKMLLQLERKHNQSRRIIDPTDSTNRQKFAENADLIRRIKKQIIDDTRQQQQRRRAQQAESDSWSMGHLTVFVGGALAGVICVASLIIMMLGNSKDKYVR